MDIESQIKQIAIESVLPEVKDYLQTIIEGEKPMSVKETARYFGVHPESIRRWANRAEHPLPAAYIGSNLFRARDVWQWGKEENARRIKEKPERKTFIRQRSGETAEKIRNDALENES